ncbi:MAG: hypothetical protein A2Y38_19525 [Spirochaetes bacterium GWB1_59_5]|nr:MAG: hypothetical protein A2Y38_19525 [Spirochaetes bacterium GWB1_59_5]
MAETAAPTCGAILSLGDDHGDNSCTFRCQLPPGHEGFHSEQFEHKQPEPNPEFPIQDRHREPGRVQVTWEFDQRTTCPHHGLQPTDECKPCWEAMMAWEAERDCPECSGSGHRWWEGEGTTPCAPCQGTGWLNPEDIVQAQAGILPLARTYKEEHFFF